MGETTVQWCGVSLTTNLGQAVIKMRSVETQNCQLSVIMADCLSTLKSD